MASALETDEDDVPAESDALSPVYNASSLSEVLRPMKVDWDESRIPEHLR